MTPTWTLIGSTPTVAAARDATGDVAAGVDEPLLADATGYQDRWYEIQTGFVDEPNRAGPERGRAADRGRGRPDAQAQHRAPDVRCAQGAGDDVSTEDLRVTFQRYRTFFDRLLAA